MEAGKTRTFERVAWADGSVSAAAFEGLFGAVAQLVERQLCKLDVRGSSPLRSISGWWWVCVGGTHKEVAEGKRAVGCGWGWMWVGVGDRVIGVPVVWAEMGWCWVRTVENSLG